MPLPWYPGSAAQTMTTAAARTQEPWEGVVKHWLRTGRLPKAVGLAVVFIGVFVDWWYARRG